MVRTLTVVIGLAMSVMVAREASAIPITPVDLDSWVGGSIVGSQSDLFKVANPPVTIGDISSDVFFDGSRVHLCAHGDSPRHPSEQLVFRHGI